MPALEQKCPDKNVLTWHHFPFQTAYFTRLNITAISETIRKGLSEVPIVRV